MVMSSACMMVAIITHTVISQRCSVGVKPWWPRAIMLASFVGPFGYGTGAEQGGNSSDATGVDLDHRAHSGAQPAHVLARREFDAHGHALHDLDPISGGVLRRQAGALCSRAGTGGGGG